MKTLRLVTRAEVDALLTCNAEHPGAWREGLRSAAARGYGHRWRVESKAFLIEPQNVFCRSCKIANATHVDHIDPHRGDEAVFWNKGNWQGLCTSCSNRKSAIERFAENVFCPTGSGGGVDPTCSPSGILQLRTVPGSGKRPEKLFRRLNTRTDVEKSFGTHEERFAKKLTPEESETISRYTGDNSINEVMRSGTAGLSPREIEGVNSEQALLDSAIAKSSFPKDATVTRYLVVPETEDVSSFVGKAIIDKAYTSTSLESKAYASLTADYASDTGQFFEDPPMVVVMRIRIKRGAKAALLGGLPGDRTFSSSEVLLPRNAKLQVRGVHDVVNPSFKVGKFKTISMDVDYD